MRNRALLSSDAAPVFAALADPNRRRIIELLSDHGASTATNLAGDLGISRQAAAKHLALIADAGLASATRSGRETRFEIRTEPLDAVTAWVRQVEGDWRRRLARLADTLQTQAEAPEPPMPAGV
jgi:DNA-binding transcriptional ArsR family regulator